MQTTLPDLPFPCKGLFSDPTDRRTSHKSKPRAYPRTDLVNLHEWTSFAHDINLVIVAKAQAKTLALHIPFTAGPLFRKVKQVWTEEEVRSHADAELHSMAQEVLDCLGIDGAFRMPGGNPAVIGAPDFYWVSTQVSTHEGHPKLVVEYKPDWVAMLQDLCHTFAKKIFCSQDEKQTIEAIEQIYGYMTFNNLRYGILTNWTNTWALQCVEMNGCKTLQCAGPFSVASQPSILKVFVGMVLLAEKDWSYASPTPDNPPPSHFTLASSSQKEQKKAISLAGKYQVKPTPENTYDLLQLDLRLCNFILSSARSTQTGCIVDTKLHQESLDCPPLPVICKIVDAVQDPSSSITLQTEADNYAALYSLQGLVIPRVYGFYVVWGILHILALEPVGTPIQQLTPHLRQKMKAALHHIHMAGYVHGDISLGNFCERDGMVFLVDLENCRRSVDKSEIDAENTLIDQL